MITEVNAENFNREVLGGGYVLADFWANWCGYCRRLNPVLDRIAEQQGELHFVKVNVDDNAAAARRYTVDVIPTLILFKDGEEKERIVNPASQDDILQFLKDNGAL